jgi:galactose mutarotase-like enzyme
VVSVTEWHGEKAAVLQNSEASAVVLPEHGGKVASLYEKAKHFELLFQNPRGSFKKASLGDDFSKYEACGFDDAFPTIDSCGICIGGRKVKYPDHGEIWSSAFDFSTGSDCVVMRCKSKILPYIYEKRVSLEENGIKCGYKISNTGEDPFPYLWAFHCLVNIEDGMGLLYPDGTGVLVNVQSSREFGAAGTEMPFTGRFLSPPREPSSKFYLKGKVREGRCGYEYPAHALRAVIEYNPDALPYLGFWCTRGGFRGDVNCAFEPATGFYDNAASAFGRGMGSVLQPSCSVSFFVKISFEDM